MGGACNMYGKEQMCIWEDNIKMDLQEKGCVGMDLIYLVQDRDGGWYL
jgi:hypothetical protein